MDRTDSGFDGSCLKAAEKEPHSVNKCNTTPTPSHISRPTGPQPTNISQPPDMNTRRSSSEKRSNGPRRSGEPRRKSIASSSENSTKSRSRGYSSKPSSRRTSCTLVDPSRPARHYRIKSSHTVPSTNGEIDDVLALHFRSCSLFHTPTYHSSLPSPTISGHGGGDKDFSFMKTNTVSAPAPLTNTDDTDILPTSMPPKRSEETMTTVEKTDTIMHWTSPSTRRREYEKIDRANSGIRGFIRRIVPKCVSGPPPPRFYENDKSDTGSVRRYRMDLSDDDDEVDEKKASLLRHQSRKLEPSRPKSAGTKTKRWGCF